MDITTIILLLSSLQVFLFGLIADLIVLEKPTAPIEEDAANAAPFFIKLRRVISLFILSFY